MTRQLGRKPILTFGNSSGDYPMFEFVTTGNSYPSMAFCLLCDDVERELGNAAILWVQKYKNRSSFAQLFEKVWKFENLCLFLQS